MHEVMRLFDYLVDMRKNKRARMVVLVLAGILLLGLGISVYLVISRWRERAAQEAFSKQFELYEKALSTEAGPHWDDLAEQWDAAYRLHASSLLAPYFLAYKAQAQAQAGHRADACATMDRVLSLVPARSDFYYLYAVTRALMEVDSLEGAVHDAGFATLEKLAHDPRNGQWDRAAYYYGIYAALGGDVDKAIAEWSVLVNKAPRASPWVELARQQLAQRAPMALAQTT